MIERSDELLAQTFREGGDREALTSLIQRYQGPVYSYLLRLLKNPHDAEEAAQDCFVRMLRGLDGYRAEMPFRPWLYRIALNCARTAVVRKKIQAERERLAGSGRPEGATGMTPADAAVRNEILRMVDDLPDPQKEAMALHYGQGLSHSEVASALDLPAGTVATRIHSGLQSLRARLASIGTVVAGITLEDVLSSAEAADAPSSILKSVLGEAARNAPSGVAAAAVQGGIVVAKTKVSVMVAVAIACSVGGGVAGYGIRSAREERTSMMLESPARPRPAAVAVAPATPGPHATAPTPALTPVSPIPLETAAATPAPKESRESKFRRLGIFVAKMIKQAESGKKNPGFDEKDSAEAIALMTDPEIQKFMAESTKGSGLGYLGSSEIFLAIIEGFDVRLSEPQKTQFQRLFEDLEARGKKIEGESGTAVDRKIAQIAVQAEWAEKFNALLTAQQRENVKTLMQLPQGAGMGVRVSIESEDRTVPSLLDAWSEKLTLSEVEKTRLSQAASLQAARLASLQAELVSRYGADFFERLSEQFEGGPKEGLIPKPDPAFDPAAREAYARLLELERQNRLALMAALPERAEEIRKAVPYVYLLALKKK